MAEPANPFYSTSLHLLRSDEFMNLHLRCVVVIEVQNYTKWSMTGPYVTIKRGHIKFPPVEVRPGHAEIMVAIKQPHSMSGSWGAVSWKMTGTGFDSSQERRAVVMWSDPFNYIHYVNTLGVGMTTPPAGQVNERWPKIMYKGKSDQHLKYATNKFYHNVNPVAVEDGFLRMTGTMATTHKSHVTIKVEPVNEENLAENLID